MNSDDEIVWAMQQAFHDALVTGANEYEAMRAAWEAAKKTLIEIDNASRQDHA